MNKTIESLEKILELTKSGQRAKFYYFEHATESRTECMCAIGCLLSSKTIDDIILADANSSDLTSELLPESVFDDLKVAGISPEFADQIQTMNDKMGDEGFIAYIQNIIESEKTNRLYYEIS